MRLVPVSTCHTWHTIHPLLAVHVFLQLSAFTVLVCAKCLYCSAAVHLLRKELKVSEVHLSLLKSI